MRVELHNVSKKFEMEAPTVNQLNLNISQGDLVTILGPSGCGKSTTLLMIAGIYPVSQGDVYFDGRRVNDVLPKDRNIGMVFQNSALYPNMSVLDNIAFPLKNKRVPKKERLQKAAEAAELVQMSDYLKRKPNQLSGGQQQRVAIARAIVKKPGLLLLDEPLSSLDANLRVSMREEIRRLQKELGITTLMVTHDQEEALTISDKIAVMNGGVLQQFGTPEELYNSPVNWFVAHFLGMPVMNELQCVWEKPGQSLRVEDTGDIINLPFTKGKEVGAIHKEQRLRWAFRPHQVHIRNEPPTTDDAYIQGKVIMTEFTGRERLIHVVLGNRIIKGYADEGSLVREGQEVWLKVGGNCYLFDYKSGLRLYSDREWKHPETGRIKLA